MPENTREASYVVVDDRFGPLAAGDKGKCLVFIADKLGQQADKGLPSNPAKFYLVKVELL